MHILCAYSGIQFEVSHFPGYFHSQETYHPIFNIPQRKLLSYVGKWSARELTSTDSYLLFLAILNSSELVQFRTSAKQTAQTSYIVENCMEDLVQIVVKINSVDVPSVRFPRFIIGHETNDLTNVHWWIENWKEAYKAFKDGYRTIHENQKLIRREQALEKLIKNPYRNPREYGSRLADWAEQAGQFPSFNITLRGVTVPISTYWKDIIIRCTGDLNIYAIDTKDLEELLNHCEEYIPAGSIHSHALFQCLRGVLRRHQNFMGIREAQANIKAILDTAPSEKPRLEQYPSKFEYLKALAKWNISQEYQQQQGEQK